MNDAQIESLLRRPPRPAAPAGLKAQLLADIRLPKSGAGALSGISLSAPFWRRWFPALSFGALLLGCFVMVAWQTSQWLSLRRENHTLRVALPDLEELRAEQEALQKRAAAAGQGTIAAREQEELVRLREEVAQLTTRAQEVATLQAENKRLQSEMAAAVAKAGLEVEKDPLAEAQGRAKRISCVSNLKQVGLALRMWSNDHKDVFPMGFSSASNEMNTPKILTCPGDSARERANNWQEFNGSSVSYEFLDPGGTDRGPAVVITRCPIHNNVGLTDGSVHQLSADHRIERIDGKWKIVRSTSP